MFDGGRMVVEAARTGVVTRMVIEDEAADDGRSSAT